MSRTALRAGTLALLVLGLLGGCAGGVEGDAEGDPSAGGNGGEAGDTSAGGAGDGGGGPADEEIGVGGESGAMAGGDAAGGAAIAGAGGTPLAGGAGGMGGVSSTAGASGTGGAMVGSDLPPPGYVPAIVGVGYGGIRLLSRDNGATWMKTAQLSRGGGDDRDLLVGITWGRGLWVTTFWQVFTSRDGLTWKEQAPPLTGCGLMARVAYGNGVFVSNCNDSVNTTVISQDGLTWKRGGTIRSGGHTDLQFAPAEGKFVAWSADAHTVFTSVDGITWTRVPELTDAAVCDGVIKSIAACGNAFRGVPGVWLRSEWRGRITRSTDGRSFVGVYTDDSDNGVATFATGWAPAP